MSANESLSREATLPNQSAIRRRAQSLLLFIEGRTAYLAAQSQRVIEALFLNPDAVPDLDLGFVDTQKEPTHVNVTASALERYAPQWKALVPDEASVRAALADLMAQKYPLRFAVMPNLRAALGLDEAKVRAAYQALYGRRLDAIYAGTAMFAAHPLAGDQTDAVLSDLEAGLEWAYLPRGEFLFRQGDEGDSLYVVINGRLRVVSRDAAGLEHVLDEITRGDIVGEMAVLTGERRSATVYAIRDTELIRLRRAEFNRLVEAHPQAMMRITQILVQRLRNMLTSPYHDVDAVTTIALVPAHADVPLAGFAAQLADALAAHGPTLRLNRDQLDQRLEPGAAYVPVEHVDNSRVVAWLSEQEAKHRFVLYEADAVSSTWTRRCLRQADRVLVVALARATPDLEEIEAEIARANPSARANPGAGVTSSQASARRDLVLLQPARDRLPEGTQAWLKAGQFARHYHVCLGHAPDFERLARLLASKGVGVVLGGGAALGLAHIGVLRALGEAGIPVDWIGGTSAGAIIAAQHALEWDFARMVETNKRLFGNAQAMFDFTPPFVSFIAGRRFTSALARMFADARLEDLWLSCFCVSSDLTRAEALVHQTGWLWRYVRASCGFPGILPPLPDEDNRLLVDGGLLDNVPIDTMRALNDGGPVIAVNVSTPTWYRDYPFGDAISAWDLLRMWFGGRAASGLRRADLVSIMVRAALLASVRSRLQQASRADVYITPPLDHIGLFDTRACDEIVRIGHAAAQQTLAEWRYSP
jgi:NTE family protein/lysophospholipid hydrolase